VAVYYGTQTGTSERFAREVEEEVKRRYGRAVRVRTTDLEHVTADTAEDTFTQGGHEPFAIFLQSTYGDGEPTDTSTEFVHWLRDQAEDGRMPDLLENLTYSVFGLGNSSYEQYNAAAKVVDKSLKSLGAVRLLKIHLGDDDCTLVRVGTFHTRYYFLSQNTVQLMTAGMALVTNRVTPRE
jgi:NADPH-ferrihemoprotein reductase